ncbi:MAG: hypothetical protein PF961_09725, partial [Planctomycetota bacterium]|nr:hypothetical protein [Planctomycetota bacterium]
MLRPLLLLPLLCTSLAAADNLVRNGSFEHSTQYWPEAGIIDHDVATHGASSVRLEGKQNLRSASFTLEPGRNVTVSFYAKAATAGYVSINPRPSNRIVGQKSKWAWNKDHNYT